MVRGKQNMQIEGRRERSLTHFPFKAHFSSPPTVEGGSLGTGNMPRSGLITTMLSKSLLFLGFIFPNSK